MNVEIEFYKMSGAGNDFVALVGPPPMDPRELARRLCRRGLSVGADGLFVIERSASTAHRMRMTHYNADGGQPDLCLNGTRCAAALAFSLGWGEDSMNASGSATARIDLMTGAGLLAATMTLSGVKVRVPLPTKPREQTLTCGGKTLRGFACHTGVPHFVRLLNQKDWAALDLDAEGAWIRSHEDLGPEGVNANFLHRPSDQGPWLLRTFERGVEGETLACGTGAVAAAATLEGLGHGALHRFTTRGGFELQVESKDDRTSNETQWFLQGDARIVFKGVLMPGAFG